MSSNSNLFTPLLALFDISYTIGHLLHMPGIDKIYRKLSYIFWINKKGSEEIKACIPRKEADWNSKAQQKSCLNLGD